MHGSLSTRLDASAIHYSALIHQNGAQPDARTIGRSGQCKDTTAVAREVTALGHQAHSKNQVLLLTTGRSRPSKSRDRLQLLPPSASGLINLLGGLPPLLDAIVWVNLTKGVG